jgi:hypothetical protein
MFINTIVQQIIVSFCGLVVLFIFECLVDIINANVPYHDRKVHKILEQTRFIIRMSQTVLLVAIAVVTFS